MPNPFNKRPRTAPKPGAVPVENSTLVCERCFEEVTTGEYYEVKNLLVFVCSNDHENRVKIEL